MQFEDKFSGLAKCVYFNKSNGLEDKKLKIHWSKLIYVSAHDL